MTTLEKMATNLGTILLARAAMIVTPVILTASIWIATSWIDGIIARVAALEISRREDGKTLQDHESRLAFNRASRLEFQETAQNQFGQIGDALDNINTALGNINVGVGKLETIINMQTYA